MDGAMFIGTWWSLVPPLLAIILALVTKEVYSSLFIGVAFGALLYTGFHPWNAFVAFFDIMKSSMNLNILIFDVLLGMIIVLMAKSVVRRLTANGPERKSSQREAPCWRQRGWEF